MKNPEAFESDSLIENLSSVNYDRQQTAVDWKRLAQFNSEVSQTLTDGDLRQECLPACAAAIAKHFDAAFVEIWIFNRDENVLEMQADSGTCSPPEQYQTRVSLGESNIGRIAKEQKFYLTDSVADDSRFHKQKKWAARERICAFAGHSIVAENKLYGVVSLFARRPFDEQVLATIAVISTTIALSIKNRIAEGKISESEKRFRTLADQAPVMVWITKQNRECTYLSRSWCEFTGQTIETALKFGWMEAVHPNDRQHLREIFAAANKRREPFQLDYRLRRADGEYRWALVSAAPRFSDAKDFLGYIGSIIDITERKQVEERLQISEVFSRSILESSPDCVKILTTDGRLEFMNENGVCLLELDDFATVKNQFWQDFWTGSEREEAATTIETAKSGAAARFQGFCPTRTGKPKWWDVIVVPVHDSSGNTLKLLSVSRDITEQKRAQDALISIERRAANDYQKLLSRIVPLAETLGTARDLVVVYRAIQEFVRASMPCAGYFVSFYDSQKKLRTAAYAWSEGREIDASSLPSIPIGKSDGPNTRAIRTRKAVIVDRYMEVIKNRPHVVIGDDGKNPNSSLVAPMIVMGRVIGTIEVQAHDFQAYSREHMVALEMAANLAAVAIENVWLLESETALRREAEAVNRAKDEFLAVLSHELRTPLNAMLGWAMLLKNEAISGEHARHAITVIERNVRLQNTLIEDLLDVSRIITGKMRIEPEKIDFNSIVETAIETALLIAEKKQIKIDFVCRAAPSEISGDPYRLQQAVGNLLSNAIKFTPENGKIRIELMHANDKVQLLVGDTGIGIEPDLLPKIFERFRQADSSTTRMYGGLGLGLAIVKSLVEMHGGIVEAASDGAGKGSTFTIELPLAVANVFPDPLRQLSVEAEVVAKNGADDSTLLEGARVLVVDDDVSTLEMIHFVLAKHGAIVETAQSANEALANINRFAPDILISDIGMSGMDGFDLIQKVRATRGAEKSFLPAIALTAYASVEDRKRALRAGFQLHIPKPIDLTQFPTTVARLLNKK